MLIGVMGSFEINGVTHGSGRRDRVIVQALAVEPGVIRSPDDLAEAIWGHSRPATWTKVVQGAIVRLRRALGRAAIESVSGGYRLVVDADDLDVASFERLVERGRSLLAVNEPARALVMFEDALRLWRGQPFEDVLDWPPGRDESLRLIEVRSAVQEERLEAALACGRTHEAVSDSRRLVLDAPYRERRWHLLASALYGTGRQAEALEALRTARRVLRDEHGLDPSPALASLEEAILRQDATLPQMRRAHRASGVCPYPGLTPFQAGDSVHFVGRETDVASCLRRITEHPLLVIVGPSGCGKSSLVRAGVVPALAYRGQFMAVISPLPDPMAALERARRDAPRGAGLVVDQLEELAIGDVDRETVAEFLGAVAAWARLGPVIATLRADHLADLAATQELASLAERGIQMVAPLSEPDMRRAIEEPARRVGLVLEPGLVDLLLHDVAGEPGALPLLSHALHETWERREGDVLTVEGYLRTGGISGAVAQTADRVYDTLNDPQRTALRGLMLRLVTPTPYGAPVGTRLPAPLPGDQAEVEPVLARLVAARLVIADDNTVAIAHESLATAWPRLRAWLDEDVEGRLILGHLHVAAEGWAAAGFPPGELYRGARLQAALEWRQRSHPMLTPEEDRFLAASTAEDADATERERLTLQAQRRQNRRLRRLLGAVAALLVLTTATGVEALRSQRHAEAAAHQSAAQTKVTAAARLGADALVEPGADTSLLLARQAVALADTPQTAADLLGAVDSQQDLRSVRDLGITGFIGGQPQVSPDGQRMMALQSDGVELVDLASGRRIPGGRPMLAGDVDRSLYAAGFVDHGNTAVASEGSAGGRCRLRYFSAASGLAAGSPEPLPGSRCAKDFWTMDRPRITADGRRLISMSGTQVRIWDRRGGHWIGPRVLPVPGIPDGKPIPRTVTTSTDDSRAAIIVELGFAAPWYRFLEIVVVVDLDHARLQARPVVDPNTSMAALSPDGSAVAVGGYDGTLDVRPVRRVDRAAPLLRLPGESGVTALAWSRDGGRLAVGRSDGRVQLAGSTGLVISTRIGHRGPVSLVAIVAGGLRLVSMDDSGVLLVRDLAGRGTLGPRRVIPRPHAVLVGPHGTPIAVGLENGLVQLYDPDRLTPLSRPLSLGPYPVADTTAAPAIHRRVSALAMTSDGTRLVAGDRVGHLRVWSLLGRKLLWLRDDVPVAFLAVSPNGRFLATAEFTQSVDDPAPDSSPQTSQVRLWNLQDGSLLATRNTDARKPRALAFSTDSRRLLVGFFDNGANVLDVPSGHLVRNMDQTVSAIAFSPDGSTVIVVDFAGTASVLSTHDWRVRERFPIEVEGAYVHLAFSADGRFLFISGALTTAIWDGHQHRLLVPSFSLGGEGTNDAIFLAAPVDRDELILATQTTLTRIDLRQHEWERAACEVAGRHLTKDEWSRFLPDQPYAPACTT
jgi:WD40 repeat protein/DNA-binding SARP family transcriptional activator